MKTSKMRRKIQVEANKSCGMLHLFINKKFCPEDGTSLHARIFLVYLRNNMMQA
jgi:hypothetical protein